MAETETGTPTGGGGKKDEYTRPQRVRWCLALLVAVAGGIYMLGGVEHQTLCHGTIATEGEEVVKVCGAPGLTQLLPFIIVVALLLAPDLSELAIPGLLSIKRRVEEQGRRQERIETELVRVEQNARLSANTYLAVHNHGLAGVDLKALELKQSQFEEELEEMKGEKGNGPGPEEPPPRESVPQPQPPDMDGGGAGEKAAPSAPEEAEERFEAEAASPQERDRDVGEGVSDEEDQRASLTLQLLWLVKNLEQYEAISRLRRSDPSQRMASLTEDQQERVDRWYNLFGEELKAAREVRNAVAHNPYAASIEELQEATRIGRRLMRILLNGLGLSTKPIDSHEES